MAPPAARATLFFALAWLLLSSPAVAADPSAENGNPGEVCAGAERRVERLRKESAERLAAKDGEVADKLAEAALRISRIENESERIRREHADELAARDVELADKIAEAELRISRVEKENERIRKETADQLAAKDAQAAGAAEQLTQLETETGEKIEGLQDQVAFVQAKADRERADLIRSAQKKIDEAQARGEATQREAQQKIDEAEAKAQERVRLLEMIQRDRDDEHKKELFDLRSIHDEEIRAMGESAETRIRTVHREMEKTKERAEEKLISEQAKHAEVVYEMEEEIASADAKLTAEKKISAELQEELLNVKAEAAEKRKRLDGDIQLLRSNSFKLEKEVSSWKENHDSQGYCNATLITEDGKRLLTSAWDSASEKTAALYDEYLADVIDENLAPLYNEHIRPVYNQHVLPVYTEHISPAIRAVGGAASKEARKARRGAAELVRRSSSSALDLAKEGEIDGVLPASLVSLLVRSSTDGEWAVDALFGGLLAIVAVLGRSLPLRVVRGILSLVWFLCPLRLFVGAARKAELENDRGKKATTGSSTKENDKSGTTPANEMKKTNGRKSKVRTKN